MEVREDAERLGQSRVVAGAKVLGCSLAYEGIEAGRRHGFHSA